MNKTKHSSAGFALDVNVNITVKDNNNNIIKTVSKHNRATEKLLEGMLRFLRGDFTTSNRQPKAEAIRNIHNAKNYIPCYVGAGTYGIKINETTGLPDYNEDNRRDPPVISEELDNEYAKFSDTTLKQEILTTTRFEIGILDDAIETEPNVVADSVQMILGADITPDYFCSAAYNKDTDIFITELGLFSTPTPGDDNLLARVVFHKTEDSDDILYVRPQDTIILRWTICLISLNDWSETGDEVEPDNNADMTITNINIERED